MHYVLSSKWSLVDHFVIADDSGTPRFDVHGNFGVMQHLSLRDQSGQELALIKKHLATTRHEILVGGRRMAEVHHDGFFGEHYEIDSSMGRLTAKGNFGGWQYSIDHDHRRIADVHRELALREKFSVQIAEGQNDVFILAVVLAIDAIHDERRQQEGHTSGGLGGLGGLLG
jgi:uncharacterized protein YxjI